MVNFLNTLNKKIEEITRPPNIPVGTYRARVVKQPETVEISNGAYTCIDFRLLLVEAMDDVDSESLEKYGGLGPNAQQRYRFMFNNDDTTEVQASNARTEFSLKRFLIEHLRAEGSTINEALMNSVGSECLVTIKWRADREDPETQYSEVGRTAAL